MAEWERGSRRPRNSAQIRRLAEALALPPETVYRALGKTPPPSDQDAPDDLEALFRATREALLRAYRVGDTAAMAASEERLRELGPKIPQRVAAEFLAGHALDPMAVVDLGGMLFHVDQWNAAALTLEGALKVVPKASPLKVRVESNLGMIYAALGDFDMALLHDEAYLAAAMEQHDGWLSVLAHGQWVEHQILRNPRNSDLFQHLEAMKRWNESGVRPDPFLEMWEVLSRAQIALANDERPSAESLMHQVREHFREHAVLSTEALAVAVVEAKYTAAYVSLPLALEQLQDRVDHLASSRPLVERLNAQQELCRLAAANGTAEAREWQLTLLATYSGLGAWPWVERLSTEWDIDLEQYPMLKTGPKSPR